MRLANEPINGYKPGYNHRDAEIASIQTFMEAAAEYATGDVLDVGGRDKPYLRYFNQIKSYTVLDIDADYADINIDICSWYAPENIYDTVISNQALQYMRSPEIAVENMATVLKPGGHLIMTGPLTWPLVQSSDLFRFTLPCILDLLKPHSMEIVFAQYRIGLISGLLGKHSPSLDDKMPQGWAIIAKKVK